MRIDIPVHSMQCRIDYFLATHLPSETREMAEIVDAAQL